MAITAKILEEQPFYQWLLNSPLYKGASEGLMPEGGPDAITESGIYHTAYSQTSLLPDNGAYGWFIHIRRTEDMAVQVFISAYDKIVMYIRAKNPEKGWLPWAKFIGTSTN